MKIFTTNLRSLFSRNKTTSFSPTDILFQAQLPFLRQRFRPYLEEVVMPGDDGISTFVCQLPADESIKDFRSRVFTGEWGDFEPKGVSLSVRSCYSGPVTVRVKVGRAE